MHDARAWPVECYMLFVCFVDCCLWLTDMNWEVVLDVVIFPDERHH